LNPKKEPAQRAGFFLGIDGDQRRWTIASYEPQENLFVPHELALERDDSPFATEQAEMSFSAFFLPH